MTITKENFNEYVTIATDLMLSGLEPNAYFVANKARDAYFKFENKEPESFDLMRLYGIFICSQWRTLKERGNYLTLSETLDTDPWWSDDYIEGKSNLDKAMAYKEKALAYECLALEWAKGQEKFDIYMEHALTYIDKAIELYTSLSENDNFYLESYKTSKILKSKFLLAKSNDLTRRRAISLFKENLSEEQKEWLTEIDNHFNRLTLETVINRENISDEVKAEVFKDLLEDIHHRETKI